jgi:hypothetical protein
MGLVLVRQEWNRLITQTPLSVRVRQFGTESNASDRVEPTGLQEPRNRPIVPSVISIMSWRRRAAR